MRVGRVDKSKHCKQTRVNTEMYFWAEHRSSIQCIHSTPLILLSSFAEPNVKCKFLSTMLVHHSLLHRLLLRWPSLHVESTLLPQLLAIHLCIVLSVAICFCDKCIPDLLEWVHINLQQRSNHKYLSAVLCPLSSCSQWSMVLLY